jgi:hypothetical protein
MSPAAFAERLNAKAVPRFAKGANVSAQGARIRAYSHQLVLNLFAPVARSSLTQLRRPSSLIDVSCNTLGCPAKGKIAKAADGVFAMTTRRTPGPVAAACPGG